MADVINPWYIPGWTIQNPQTLFEVLPVSPPVYPVGINLVTVTGTYASIAGTPVGGAVLFKMLDRAVAAAITTTVLPDKIIGTITAGQLSVSIPAGFTYQIKEVIQGGLVWNVAVPANQVSPVDINSLPVV